MGYKLIIRPLAAIEILESYDWYETIKEGLGTRFLYELEGFYEKLILSPKAHSYYNKPVRQGKIKKFPFVVVYELFDHTNTIVVYSVFMTKQDPSKKRSK